MVYGDLNSCQYETDRASGALNGCDKAHHALWRVLNKFNMRDLMVEAASPAPPPMTYHPGGIPTSRIDVLMVSGNMGPARAATARGLGDFSATHVPLAATLQDNSIFQPGPQDKRGKGACKHAVAFMCRGMGRRWNIKGEGLTRFRLQGGL